MEITKIHIRLADDANRYNRLRAFCLVIFNNLFAVRDLKIIQSNAGRYFVAMPCRKLHDSCPECMTKNHLRARFCNGCGTRLSDDRVTTDDEGRLILYADLMHPLTNSCRTKLEAVILTAYLEELERAQAPNYVSSYDQAHCTYFSESTINFTPRLV